VRTVKLDIEVRPVGGGEYAVAVKEGAAVSEVSVVASERFLAELDAPDAPVEEVVREAVVVILDQRPGGDLGDEIDLEDVAGYDEAFVPELQSRLGF
jgi:phage tail sheath gpL-like